MFGGLGGPELFLIMVIALIVFGPRKLPEIGKSMGKMMAEFRKASQEFRQTIESEVEAEKIRDATRIEMPRFDSPPAATPAPAPDAPSSLGVESHHPDIPPEPAPIEPSTVSRDVAPTPIESK
jgi:Tat protein translocase TatB subunit